MESSKRKNRVNTAIAILVLGAIALVILYVYLSVQRAFVRVHVYGCLRTISSALHQYHDEYGSFPPVTVNDDVGRTLHSWRTLLEPQIAADFGKPELFDGYNLTEPWDSSGNLRVSEPHPLNHFEYRFFAVTGNDCAWSRTEPLAMKDLKRRTGALAMVIGIKTVKYHWRNPVDVDVDENGLPFLDGVALDPLGEYSVLYSDGTVQHHTSGKFSELLQSLTINKEADSLAW